MVGYIEYLAARWLAKQARRLAKQLPGIRRAEDIECVHRARVACRRLRAGLVLFADWPSPKWNRACQQQIRRVGRKLGQARDKDVQICFLADQSAQAPSLPIRVGLAALILSYQAQRESAYRKASKAAFRLERSRLLADLRTHTDQVLRREKISEGALFHCPLWEEAAEKIQNYINELLSHAASLEQSHQEAEHHALRIVGKKLRYSLEILTPVFGPEVQPTLEALETFQDLMGRLHDCQVWLLELQRWQKRKSVRWLRKKWKKAGFASEWMIQAFQAGLQWLEQGQQLAQAKLLEEAGWFWHERLHQEITHRLVPLLGQALARTKKPTGTSPDRLAVE